MRCCWLTRRSKVKLEADVIDDYLTSFFFLKFFQKQSLITTTNIALIIWQKKSNSIQFEIGKENFFTLKSFNKSTSLFFFKRIRFSLNVKLPNMDFGKLISLKWTRYNKNMSFWCPFVKDFFHYYHNKERKKVS